MTEKRIRCPECGGHAIVKYGFANTIRNRKRRRIQRYLCNDCLRVFQDPAQSVRRN